MKKTTTQALKPLSVLLFLGVTAPTTALALDPFTCEDTVYQAIYGDLKSLDLTTGNYGTNIIQPINNNADPFTNLNGMGYNETDGFIYGLVAKHGSTVQEIPNDHLVRIDANGVVEDLGFVPNTTNSGDVFNDTLYLAHGTKFFTIDNLSTRTPASSISINIQNFPSTFGADLVAVSKDGNDYLFGAKSTQLVVVDITDTNNITQSLVTVSGLGSGSYGAMWTDVNGYLYAGNNNGNIYVIENPTDPSPTATFLISTQATGVNDGISCASSNPFEEILDTDDDGVANDLDLDDDNDGILDSLEN